MTKKHTAPPLKTLDELETALETTINQPTAKKVTMMGVELHGQFHRVFNHQQANPDESFDRERFAKLSHRLMVEVFGIEEETTGGK